MRNNQKVNNLTQIILSKYKKSNYNSTV